MSNQQKSRATESFYGRRKAQRLRGRKQRLVEKMLPQLRLDLAKPVG